MKIIKSRLWLLLAGLFACFTVIVFAPFEMFFGNIAEFWFTFGDFWFIPVLLCIVALAIIYLVGWFLKGKLYTVYCALLFGGGLAFYLQGNFLNIKIGVLNGSAIDWAAYKTQFLINIAIWAIIIASVLVFTLIKSNVAEKIETFICFVLILTQAVSLGFFAVKSIPSAPTESDMQLTVKDITTLSENKNVVVFLLDMLDNEYLKKAFAESPELKDNFNGFTMFTNSIGSGNTTLYSMGAILNGEHILNKGKNWPSSLDAQFSTDAYDNLKKNGYELGLYTENVFSAPALREKCVNYLDAKQYISSYKQFTKMLYRFALCKYAPDIVKPFIWIYNTPFIDLSVTKNESAVLNSSIVNSQFKSLVFDEKLKLSNSENLFKFYHINATHYPCDIDENMQQTSDGDPIAATKGSLKIISNYLDQMRELGIYESSSIIIMADHGYYWDGVLTSPALMAKQSGNTDAAALDYSDAPVSHLDILPTIMSEAGVAYTKSENSKSIFDIKPDEDRERYFYQYFLGEPAPSQKYRLIEYTVDKENNLRSSFHLTDKEITVDGKIISHKENCAFCSTDGTEPPETDPLDPVRILHPIP